MSMEIVGNPQIYKKFYNGKLQLIKVKQIVVKDKRGFTKIENEEVEFIYGK